MYSRDQLIDFANSLVAELSPPPPPPSDNHNTLKVTVHDVYMAPGQRLARVPISLSEPAKQTEVFKVITANGAGTNQGTHYTASSAWLRFQPGEQVKMVEVKTLRDLAVDQYLYLAAQGPQSSKGSQALQFTQAKGKIHGDPAWPRHPVMQATARPLPVKALGLTLVFNEDFTNFIATDSGYVNDDETAKLPCWRSRLGHGYEQEAELGYYANTKVCPGTTPILVEGAVVSLQSEYFLNGVLDANGQVISDDTPACGFYQYTASMITTQRFPFDIKPGTYVEGRMKMPTAKGSWPAFWAIPKNYWTWPSWEFDIFEGFFKRATAAASDIGSTVHWATATNVHAFFYNFLGDLGIDLTQPQTWGMWWDYDGSITYFLNDVPYMKVGDVLTPANKELPGFLMINIAVGGQGGAPDPALWPIKMPIEFVRVWQ